MVLSPRDRALIYRRLVALMKEHFGDDALGRRKAWYFLPWHFSFLHRWVGTRLLAAGAGCQGWGWGTYYSLVLTGMALVVVEMVTLTLAMGFIIDDQ